MDKYTATELAFKNGYEKGYEAAKAEIVHCKECEHMGITPDSFRWCYVWDGINVMGDEGYCNYGEKRVKPNISKQTADALNKMGKAVHGGNDG